MPGAFVVCSEGIDDVVFEPVMLMPAPEPEPKNVREDAKLVAASLDSDQRNFELMGQLCV